MSRLPRIAQVMATPVGHIITVTQQGAALRAKCDVYTIAASADEGCWTELPHTHNFNGQLHPAPDLRACQDACWYNVSCDGVDWNPLLPVGQQCYLSGNWTTLRQVSQMNITLYILNRHNCSK